MSLEFHKPQLSDKQTADSIFHNQTERLCEYTFGNIFIWQHLYRTTIAVQDGFLFIKAFEDDGQPFYIFPAGNGDIEKAITLLNEDAARGGHRLAFFAVTETMKQTLERLCPGRFEFLAQRDSFDYIYSAESLISLAGKKLHGKRNHIARFEKLDAWSYEAITPQNLAECEVMNEEWCRLNGCGQDEGKKEEYCAVRRSFRNYGALGFTGGLLRLEGRVVAFTMGEQLGVDTFNTHIEKAFFDVEGAYAMINREFAAHNCAGYAYINREEDMGVEGLRRAKLSYNPAILLEKYRAMPR